MLPNFRYVRAKSVADAVRQLGAPGAAAVHAGGTDLLGCVRDEILTPDRVVSIAGLEELKGIAALPAGGLRIGALTPLAVVASDPAITGKYRGLAQAAGAAASPQLRNQGTLGGNICQRPRCWYYRGDFHCLRKGGDRCFAVQGQNDNHCILGGENCYIVHPSDTAPALVALGARIRVAGPGGSRLVPAGSFFVGPAQNVTRENILQKNEIVTEILLPPAEAGLVSSYRKIRGRGAWDFALAGVALAVLLKGGTVERARVVLSGAAPIPWRAEGVEKAIAGKRLTPDVIAAAAGAATAGAEPLEKNGYKLALFTGVVAESLEAVAASPEAKG